MFPSMVVQMIGVGETTGALDTMLAKIADFYEEEVDTAVAGLLTLLEPIMIAFLGVRRRRHRHRDVPADLRPDQQADGMSTTAWTLRRRLDVADRGRGSCVATLLLGSAIAASRSTAPGSLAGRSVLLPDRPDLRADASSTR